MALSNITSPLGRGEAALGLKKIRGGTRHETHRIPAENSALAAPMNA
jgi:hypothetical protein